MFNFSVWNYNPPFVDYGLVPQIDTNKPQQRFLANNNRIILGVLVQQTMWTIGTCPTHRFAEIDAECQKREWSSHPFGADAFFMQNSDLFDGTLNMSAFYRPSEISPYGVPYGFFPDSPGEARERPR